MAWSGGNRRAEVARVLCCEEYPPGACTAKNFDRWRECIHHSSAEIGLSLGSSTQRIMHVTSYKGQQTRGGTTSLQEHCAYGLVWRTLGLDAYA